MDVKEVAKKQISKMQIIVGQISEAEDLLAALDTPKLNNLTEPTNDVSVGFPSQFTERWHRVRLEEDLGITDIQKEIRKLVAESVQKRIKVLESELQKNIYPDGYPYE